MEFNAAKLSLATFGGIIASWFGHVWEFAALVIAAMILDYATGLLAGRANEGLNSRRATQGLYKKVGFLFLLTLSFFLDGAFNHFLARGFSFEMPFDLPIGLIVSVWIVVTEAISICENLGRLGVPIPSWLMKLLKKAKKNIDEENVK